jgi:hypothetical protein
MSRVSIIRSAQSWHRAVFTLTLVPLLLWSSFSSFGYSCRSGQYEPFCLAVDCCAGADNRTTSAPRCKDRGGSWHASQWQTTSCAGCPATSDDCLVSPDPTGSGFGHESSCQPVLKQPGRSRVETWETGRDTHAAGTLLVNCNEGCVAAVMHTVEAASLPCGRVDGLQAVLQRFTT